MKYRNTTPKRFRNYNPFFHFEVPTDKILDILVSDGFPLTTMVVKKDTPQEAINEFFKFPSSKVAIWNSRNLSDPQLTKFQDCLYYYLSKIELSRLKSEPFLTTGPNNDWIVMETSGVLSIYPD
jgi:hypothetical protein